MFDDSPKSDRVTPSVRLLAEVATNERSETVKTTASAIVRHRWVDRLAKSGVSQERFAREMADAGMPVTTRALQNYVAGRRAADETVAAVADAVVLRLSRRTG